VASRSGGASGKAAQGDEMAWADASGGGGAVLDDGWRGEHPGRVVHVGAGARVRAGAGNIGKKEKGKEKGKRKGEKEKREKRKKRGAGGIRGDGREHATASAVRDACETRRTER